MRECYDLIVVGGGPAGYTAALYGARAGLSVLVLEMLSPGGQMATTSQIDNFPGLAAGADGFAIGEQMQAAAEAFGAKSLFAEVTALELRAQPKTVTTSEGTFAARAVILATGAAPRRLGLPGEDALTGRGISYCATCDGMFYKGKTVAVLGGGNTAAAEALELAHLCEKVYLVHRRDTLRADAIYEAPLLAARNIECIWNKQILALEHGDVLTGLRLKDTVTGAESTLAVDGAFVAIGRAPNTALAEGQLALAPGGYIPAGEDTATAIPGVYAAGDLRTKPLRQIVTAAADGAVAATQAAAWLRAQP